MEEFLPSSWTVYHTHNGPCPYRAVGQWDNLTFYADQLPIETYETLLGKGFRRSGTSIYHPACENCRLCIPLRVHVPPFLPSRSQKRTQRKNQDLRIEHVPVVFREDVFELYRRYQEHWHQRGNPTSIEEFTEFLISICPSYEHFPDSQRLYPPESMYDLQDQRGKQPVSSLSSTTVS